MGEQHRSGYPAEVIINYMLIVMVVIFITFLILMLLVRKFCPPSLGEDQPPRIKKALDSAMINKYLPSRHYPDKT